MSAPAATSADAPSDSKGAESKGSPSFILPPNAPNPIATLTPEQLKCYNEFISSPQVIEQRDHWWTRQRDAEHQTRIRDKVAETPEMLSLDDQWRQWDWLYEAQRWLRATKWSTQKAIQRFVDCVKWREMHKVDYIVLNPPQQKLDLIELACPNGLFGFAKGGEPAYWERTGKAHVGAVTQLFNNSPDVKEIAYLHVWLQETALQQCRQQSRKLNRNVESIISVLDMTGLAVAHRRCVQVSIDILTLDEKYYPERMAALYCINCPRIFPVLYAIVKPFLDPVTVSKIHVISGNPHQRLLKDFEADQIPISYGGKLEEPIGFKVRPLDDILKLLKDSEPDAGNIKTETLKAGKKIEQSIKGKKGDLFAYYVKTTKDDIGLHLYYKFDPSDKSVLDEKEKEKEKNEVVPKGRYDSSCFSQSGEYIAPCGGEFVVVIDNSYSYFKEKEIHWWVERSEEGKTEELAKATDGEANGNANGHTNGVAHTNGKEKEKEEKKEIENEKGSQILS